MSNGDEEAIESLAYDKAEEILYVENRDNDRVATYKLEHTHYYQQIPHSHFQKPRGLNSFSMDATLACFCNRDQLRFYINPPTNADLNTGYHEYEKKPVDYNPRISPIIFSLRDRYKKHKKSSDFAQIEEDFRTYSKSFICWRGLITKIFVTPYQRRNEWAFFAVSVDGAILLDELVTKSDLENRRKNESNERNDLMCYWGYKFEQYCTTSDKEEALNQKRKRFRHKPVNSSEAFCKTFKSKLESHSLVMGAEADCCLVNSSGAEDDNEDDLSSFVELKTSKLIENERDRNTFERFKLLKFWAQSFIVGTPRIVVGFRDNDGIVKKIQRFKTLDIPNFVSKEKHWDSNACLKFADQVLHFIRANVVLDHMQATYIVRYNPNNQLITIERTRDRQNVSFVKAYDDLLKEKNMMD